METAGIREERRDPALIEADQQEEGATDDHGIIPSPLAVRGDRDGGYGVRGSSALTGRFGGGCYRRLRREEQPCASEQRLYGGTEFGEGH